MILNAKGDVYVITIWLGAMNAHLRHDLHQERNFLSNRSIHTAFL